MRRREPLLSALQLLTQPLQPLHESVLERKKKKMNPPRFVASPPLTVAAAAAALGQSEREETRVVRPYAVPQWQTTWPD